MEGTRQKILQAVYAEMCKHGYRGTRPDKCIAALGITKGAMYHYFPGKLQLAYAIIEEVLKPQYLAYWEPLKNFTGNPLHFLLQMVTGLSQKAGSRELLIGSPLSNLIQEMSPLDEGFRQRLQAIVDEILAIISVALAKGKEEGYVNQHVNPEITAQFILASLEGSYGMAKVAGNKQIFINCLSELERYIKNLE